MKKTVCLIAFLITTLVFSQHFKVEEDLNVRETSSYCVKDVCFSIVGGKNDERKYEYRMYLKNKYMGNLTSKVSQKLDLYHLYNNQIVLLFSGRKKMSEKREAYNDMLKDYKIVCFNVDGTGELEVKDLKSLEVKKPEVKFSSNDYSCFLFKKKGKIKLVTFTNDAVVTDINIPLEVLKKYPKLKSKKLQAINTEGYSEDVGAPINRLYCNKDYIYLTYMLPKSKKSVICKLIRNDKSFSWLGYSELGFVHLKKIKKYNSYLLKNQFYFVEKRRKQVYLSVLDLVTNKSVKYDLSKLALEKVINKYQLDRITNFFLGQVPSIMVYNQKDSDNKIIKIASISGGAVYYNNFWFQNQMFMQQQRQQQIRIPQNIRLPTPGGFHMVEFPPLGFWGLKTKTLKFLITSGGKVLDYNDEELELQKHDYKESGKLLNEYLKNKIDGFKKKYLSFDWLESGDLYYTYFNSKSREVLISVKNKE